MHDIIIVGASFAGLSTAYFTKADKNKILILEKENVLGLKQKSACCTFSDELKKLNCEKSILKTFDTLVFHSSRGFKANLKLISPVSTFDYKIFCESLVEQLKEQGVEIITDSPVFKVSFNKNPKKVFCKNGKIFQGKILVDCSGWRAVMASSLRENYFDKSKLAYGIETEIEYEGENDKINFYFGKKFIPGGYGWIFPISEDKARIGVGCYKKVDLTKPLESFLDFLDLDVKIKNLSVHGGIVPCFGLREPVVEEIFVVGDSGGQVLPFTGEGIRKSFHYGEICGNLISRVLNNGLRLQTALEEYRKEVNRSKKLYDNLAFIQKIAIHTPDKVWDKLIGKLSKKEENTLRELQKIYLEDSNKNAKLMIFPILRKIR